MHLFLFVVSPFSCFCLVCVSVVVFSLFCFCLFVVTYVAILFVCFFLWLFSMSFDGHLPLFSKKTKLSPQTADQRPICSFIHAFNAFSSIVYESFLITAFTLLNQPFVFVLFFSLLLQFRPCRHCVGRPFRSTWSTGWPLTGWSCQRHLRTTANMNERYRPAWGNSHFFLAKNIYFHNGVLRFNYRIKLTRIHC